MVDPLIRLDAIEESLVDHRLTQRGDGSDHGQCPRGIAPGDRRPPGAEPVVDDGRGIRFAHALRERGDVEERMPPTRCRPSRGGSCALPCRGRCPGGSLRGRECRGCRTPRALATACRNRRSAARRSCAPPARIAAERSNVCAAPSATAGSRQSGSLRDHPSCAATACWMPTSRSTMPTASSTEAP